jgi:hypothetical protein
MSKYYVSNNANRRIRIGELSFAFEITENFAGAWRGVLTLSKPEEIAAFEKIAASLGATEISKEEYDGHLKKKVSSTVGSASSSPVPNKMTVAGRGAAVVVKEGQLQYGKPEVSTVPIVVQSVDDLIPLGVAPYVDPLEQKLAEKPKRGKKQR